MKTHEDFFRIFLPLTLLQGFERLACERMLKTERKLHILTPLLWPSRCVFIVLLMLGSTPSGLSEGPLGLVWPSLPHLVSNSLGVCWQLHRGFPRSPSVGCGLPYYISSLTPWESAGNCIGTPNSTELNNNSTPTRSPTGSLNRMFNRHQAEINCHAVQRLLSSGASLLVAQWDLHLFPYHKP